MSDRLLLFQVIQFTICFLQAFISLPICLKKLEPTQHSPQEKMHYHFVSYFLPIFQKKKVWLSSLLAPRFLSPALLKSSFLKLLGNAAIATPGMSYFQPGTYLKALQFR